MAEIKTKTVVIPPPVEELLRYLQNSGWWPIKMEIDAPWLNALWLRFGKKVGLLETFLKYESWQWDRAAKRKPVKNHRLAFRNFCANAEKYRLQAETPPTRVGALVGAASVAPVRMNPHLPRKPLAVKNPVLTPEQIEENRRDCAALLAGKMTAADYKQKWGGKI